mgnify:CR=1 FL=1
MHCDVFDVAQEATIESAQLELANGQIHMTPRRGAGDFERINARATIIGSDVTRAVLRIQQRVIASAAHQCVNTTLKRPGARAAIKRVIASTAQQHVITVIAKDDVIAATTVDDIVTGGPGQRIIARTTVERIAAPAQTNIARDRDDPPVEIIHCNITARSFVTAIYTDSAGCGEALNLE